MIRFQCECGKAHNSPDEHAGKRGRCSGCGTVMRIPGNRPETARANPPAMKPASAVMTTAPKQARASSRLDDPDPSRLYGLDDRADARPAPAPAPRGRPCPNCVKPLPSSAATFCIECGYNLKTGKVSSVEVTKPKKVVNRKPSNVGAFFEKRLTSSKFLGGMLSLVGGTAWLVAGLMADRIYFYPIFLIIGGGIGVLSGLISGDD